LPLAWWLLGQPARLTRAGLAWAWILVLLADLWALGEPLVAVHPEEDIFAGSASVRFLQEHAGEHGRVLDINCPDMPANSTPLWPNLPLAVGVEPVRGYNPMDVLRYKEFLQFLTDQDQPLQPLDRKLTSAILGTFPIKNQSLADLLGVRYLVQPADMPLETIIQDQQGQKQWQRVLTDPAPRTYSFIPAEGNEHPAGFQTLPPYVVYENHGALPRAFVVPEAAPLPARADILAALKNNDFRQRVFLEGWTPAPGRQPAPEKPSQAEIQRYQPNQVVIQVNGPAPGYLVLADVWFPGWTCFVDGQPVPLYRADYVFRAVEVPAGSHRVTFTLAPPSYRWGKIISSMTALLVLGLTGLALLRRGQTSFFRAATARERRCPRSLAVAARNA
ncbi:MAG: YfhO family protein, partial [Planctomycetes bacterium]|nr:YfhO family protein [Planctomycetota bacterium]